MKMGEVVEDASISHQHHLQVASTVVVEDEDDDDAENGREAKKYLENLNNSFFVSCGNSSSSGGSSSSASSKTLPLSEKKRHAVYKHILPRHLNRKRRILNRKYLLALKRTPEVGGNQLPKLKARKEFELRFLEATYVRNVLFQSLPFAAEQQSASSSSRDGNALSLSLPTVPSKSNSRGGQEKVSERNKSSSSATKTNHKLTETNNDDDEENERTFVEDDLGASCPPPPRPSVISEFSVAWKNWLREKAMDPGIPDHLIKVSYDKYVANDTRRQFLIKKAEEAGSAKTHDKSGSAFNDSSSCASASSSSSLLLTENTTANNSNDGSSNASSSACVSGGGKADESSKSSLVTTTPLVPITNAPKKADDSSGSSLITPSGPAATTNVNASPLAGVNNKNAPSSSSSETTEAISNCSSSSIGSSSTAALALSEATLNKSAQDATGASISTEAQMRPRSHHQKTSKEERKALMGRNNNPATFQNSLEDAKNNKSVAISVAKEEGEKGRKLVTNTRKSSLQAQAAAQAAAAAAAAAAATVTAVSPTTFDVTSKSASSLNASSNLTLNDSDLILKSSVINENTDSSSSTSTSVSCSSTSNDNLTLSISSHANALNPIQSLHHNNNSSGSASGGNASSSSASSDAGTVTPTPTSTGTLKSNKKFSSGPKAPKKYSEKMKAEASVLQRISELQKEGMWWEKRLPKVYEPPRVKSHWDYLLEEMTWMHSDFVHERKWKRNAAKKCARMIEKYFHDKELKRQKAEKEEEVRKKKTAAGIAKLIRQFWSNVQTVVEFKEQTIIDSMRKKALDQKLSYLVNETEKYSEIVAQTFTAIAKKTGIDNEDNDDGKASDTSSVASSKVTTVPSIKEEAASPLPMTEDDAEFVPPSDSESDVDDTIAEEEAKERVESTDHANELEDLEAEKNMSYDELIAKYAKYLQQPEAFKEPEPEPQPKIPEKRMTRGRVVAGRQLRGRRQPVKVQESDLETDDTTSSTEEEEEDDDAASEAEKTNDADLASLLKSISDSDQKKHTEEETNKLADLAESFKPKGNTLSSTTVVTKVPHILRHSLREYQHIGLDWLVTMYDKKLNGILADEMGLGKTIQTIALLAYLAVERGNWGPHLIIVPTSVMLNWEMEFKKWCPGFKILTYYGSQKERKLKRSGWTKPNAFHVCITSYKLVIQDHQSFRRKRWKYLILDEAQNIKNFKSQRWQLLLNFHTQRRLLLTGTPLQNNLMELWSLLHFLMPNVFQSHMEFKDWFSNPMSGMVEGSQEYNEDIVRRLHKVLRPFILRRMKSEVEKQLPQKFEHVVMCSLSKRQRYLYEEFMSRTKTKETLNQGNLLSVINVLMQLRKVCNHPNLFEPRPIVSPFQTEGINFSVPSSAWDLLRDIQESSFRQYFPLFNVSNPSTAYNEYDAERISELTPLFAYNPDEDRRYVTMNYQNLEKVQQPPPKRIRRIVNLVKNEPPPCPRLQRPLTFFMSSGKPDKLLQDQEFVDCLKRDATQKQSILKVQGDKEEGSRKKSESPKSNGGDKTGSAESSDSENEGSSSDSEFEEVVVVRKRKAPVPRLNITTRLQMMGCSVPDFELNYIQERKLQDRKSVVDSLNKVNWARCRVKTFMNQQLVETCQVVGALPPLRLTSRRTGIKVPPPPKERTRDCKNYGFFNLGYDDIMTIIRVRQERPELMHHPSLMWSMTKHLETLILTPEARVQDTMEILRRYVMYIPAVSAPALGKQIYRPATSAQYFTHLTQIDDFRKQFSKATDIVHPIVSRMLTQFPDPRLIQYDCGKLQTLDTLLRRLKAGNHRVLIFTQMAKVLDILEAFLNYHGHTYLRLDGATKIDQRQLLMERFNADKKIFCFILSTRSGGIGVNLTGADTVIFYDSDWNPTMDAQAQDRCHRIGQTRDVHIYRLVSEKTVEENILKKSNQKRLLGELAIEGGKFTTTYFKQNTIRELFTINELDDVAKRLNAWDVDPSADDKSQGGDGDEATSFNPTDLMRSPEKRHEMQMIECALAAAEDDTDVQAAQTVHAEAEAEMAEFDESVSLDALDEGKTGPNKFEIEFQQVFEQLTDVERYALRLMESTIDDWSKETVAQAQKDLEEQKLAWELQQQKTLHESKMEIDDDSSCTTDDLLTYSRVDNINQVWVAQFGTFEQEMLFPIYEPPTPPRDEMDVYFDTTLGYLYDYDIMTEAQLPPVYVPKHPKKLPTPVSSPVSKPGIEKTPEPVKESAPEQTELDSDSTSPQKKSPKVGRREDPIFAPRSIFDRPSPAMAKLRRDLRLQRYNQRPASTSPKTLGPGSVTFSISSNIPKTPPPPTPTDCPDWLFAEDYNLLQSVRNVLELPLGLIVVNLAQTPNWDYAQEAVNTVGFYHRTGKHCKWRYENVVAPREEGKLLYEPPSNDPVSPSSGKKKKAKQFIKIAPPTSPAKTARAIKVSQLLSQDNNTQFKNIFCAKFDTIKQIANKRAPTTKPVCVNAAVKSNKHSQVIAEFGINFDNPLPATAIAQARYDRIQMERKKMEIARQQAVVTVPATTQPPANQTPPPPVSMGQGIPTQMMGTSQAAMAAAISAVSAASPNANSSKQRGVFTPVTLTGTISPLVLQASNSGEIVHRDMNIPNLMAQQRTRHAEMMTPQQQAQLMQQKQTLGQAQSLTSLLNQQPQNAPQLSVSAPQQPQPNVTVLSAGSVPVVGTSHSQPNVRPPPPVTIPVQFQSATHTQTSTVVIAPAIAQALGATAGPITVNASAVNTSSVLSSAVSTASTGHNVSRHMPPTIVSSSQQLQRVPGPTITMQGLVSSATTTQRMQAAGIITSSAPTLQPGSTPQPSQQPTLVSLTPMMGTGGNPQLTTKLIQSPQGLATLVQSSPTRNASPSMSQQQSGSKIVNNPLQLQYIRGGLIRQSSPVNATVSQQQVQQVIKEQYLNSPTSQIKRIQVVAASPPQTIVSSSSGQPQQNPVSMQPPASVSNMPTASSYSTIPVVQATTCPPVVSISSPGTVSKVSLSQPNVTMAISSPSPSSATATVLHQQAQRQIQVSLPQPPNVSMSISSPSVSSVTAPVMHPHQQVQQRQVQLVKQQTVGGKTITRPVTDAEMAAILKHGLPLSQSPVSVQSMLPGSKNPVATFQGSVIVQGTPTPLTMGLQNLAMKVQPAPAGSVAILKYHGTSAPVSTSTGSPKAQPVVGTTPVSVAPMNPQVAPIRMPQTIATMQQFHQVISQGQVLQAQMIQQKPGTSSPIHARIVPVSLSNLGAPPPSGGVGKPPPEKK